MDRLDTANVIFGKFGNHFLIYPNFFVRLKEASSLAFKDDFTASRDPAAAHRRQLKERSRSCETYRMLTMFHGRGYFARCFLEVAVSSVERFERAKRSAPWKPPSQALARLYHRVGLYHSVWPRRRLGVVGVRLLSLRRRFIFAAQAHRSCFRRICIALPSLVDQRADLILIDPFKCVHLSRR